MKPKIIIHGGAGSFESKSIQFKEYRAALKKIITKAYDKLLSDGSRAAVVYSVRLMENNPIFNAGTGSKIQKDGQIRMSAAIMSSDDNKFSAVVNIKNVKNPIAVADLLRSEKYRVLGGNEATEYARIQQFKYHNPTVEHRLKEYKDELVGETGTVGAVALDQHGVITVGTSTGGVGYELPGRIGDSATVAGTYVSKVCGVSCTGKGEDIINQAVAARLVSRVENGVKLSDAASDCTKEADSFKYKFGFIALNSGGEFCVGQTSNMDVLYAQYDGDNLKLFLDE